MNNERKEMRIKVKDIEQALEDLFTSGYTYLQIYETGATLLSFGSNEYFADQGHVVYETSLLDLLEGFVEDTDMATGDVESLDTENPDGVRFEEYIEAVAWDICNNIENCEYEGDD
jgi:hypothetical protein